MALPEPIDPPEPPDFPPPEIPGTLPRLAGYLRPRYTCNVAVTEEMKVMDLLNDVIFPSSRMFLSQGANGKIRMHNKKPVDWALGTAEFEANSNVISLDDVSQWIDNYANFLLVDPYTNKSEVRRVDNAAYSLDQNAVTITGDAIFTIIDFAGCDGAETPATAQAEVDSFVADTTYSITFDGVEIVFTPSSSDTTETIASFLAGAFRGHPDLIRRFGVSWTAGTSVIDIVAKFGDITLDADLEVEHVGPVANPIAGPVLADGGAGTLPAGTYRVCYSYKNDHGQTLLSPYSSITLAANKKISVTAVSEPAGTTVLWYCSCEGGSNKIRFHSENNGSAFNIEALPRLSAPLPPDLNRTGTEVMRVRAVFSDRSEPRTNLNRSNVIRASFEWILGKRNKTINRIDLKYRDANQDYRLMELRLRDDVHIAKTKKISNEEINGQAIDNYFQAYRICAGLLAEKLDADFFYRWSATREALLLEEGDVVAITDDGSGVYNLPVMIEGIELDPSNASLPKVDFTGRKFANSLYDDSVADRTIPVVVEY